MNSSNLMAGVLVVGAILPSAEAPHYCQYNKSANPVRANRKLYLFASALAKATVNRATLSIF